MWKRHGDAMPLQPHYPRCFATLFYNDTSGGTTARRSFLHDEAMARLFVSRMINMTDLPIFVLINRDNDAKSVLGPWLTSGQVRLRRVRPVVVEPAGTLTWYRMTHTKFQAWTLFRDCGQVALLDYDGIPLQRMDPYIFDACGAAPLCGIVDQVTPISECRQIFAANICSSRAACCSDCCSFLQPVPTATRSNPASRRQRHPLPVHEHWRAGAAAQPHCAPGADTPRSGGRGEASRAILCGAGTLPS